MIIVDANIVFSATIKPSGVIGRILFSEKNELLVAPTHLQEEIEEHKPRLVAITKKRKPKLSLFWKHFLRR